MRFNKIYVEIGNICNLKCSFCPTLKREKRRMTPDEFGCICQEIRPYTDFIYLHLMGEPLCHPNLEELLSIAKAFGFRVCITTNGTLLSEREELLISHSDTIHKISISLHCIEGNDIESRLAYYMTSVTDFSKKAAQCGIYTVLRLWNLDTNEKSGENSQNEYIENRLKSEFPCEWKKRWNGFGVSERIFLEYAGIFTWPDESDAEPRDKGYCHGLGDQIGILADGTVVPCCLDSEGHIALGNIFDETLDEILASDRAEKMIKGFAEGEMAEELCKKCSFAHRFSKN